MSFHIAVSYETNSFSFFPICLKSVSNARTACTFFLFCFCSYCDLARCRVHVATCPTRMLPRKQISKQRLLLFSDHVMSKTISS